MLVVDSVLFANLFDDWLEICVMIRIDGRKEMMDDLKVKPASEDSRKTTAIIGCGGDLRNSPIQFEMFWKDTFV